jgi:L-asparaginase II
MTDPHGHVPVAAVERNGFDEGYHFGRVIALDRDGAELFSYGDVDAPVHPRSANKLMQASGLRSMQLRLDGGLLALSAASHWGEPAHVDGVRSILAAAGLDESALQTTPDLPEDPEARRVAMCADNTRRPIYHGCSGKHAAMLATCVQNGWDLTTYLAPEHPLQTALRANLESTVGATTSHTAVDGCGAPAWAIPLRSLASAYRAAVLADVGTPLRDVADAMRAHPQMVGGEGSEVTGLMRAVPGLLLKDGAESVYVAAVPDGRAVALKVADGGFRAGQSVLVAALSRLGVAERADVDHEAFQRWGTVPVLGHGEPVGRIRPLI